MVGDSLVGITKQPPVFEEVSFAMPLVDVQSVSFRRFSAARTALLVTVVGAGVLVLLELALGDLGSGFGKNACGFYCTP